VAAVLVHDGVQRVPRGLAFCADHLPPGYALSDVDDPYHEVRLELTRRQAKDVLLWLKEHGRGS